MLYAGLGLLLVTGSYPLLQAWRAARRTTLRHTIAWAATAWLAWCLAAFASAAWPAADPRLSRFFALCLSGCAGVAVLGARRPIVGAWDFVAASLFAVLAWPAAEGWGEPRLNLFNVAFLAAALAVGTLNYLPTRTAAAAVPAGAACALAFCVVVKAVRPELWDPVCIALMAVAPWLGLAAVRRPTRPADAFDREWLAFRDGFGALWALPARDQFNRASANGGWGVVLDWHGLRPTANAPPAEALAGLRGVLKRFGPREEGES